MSHVLSAIIEIDVGALRAHHGLGLLAVEITIQEACVGVVDADGRHSRVEGCVADGE